MPPPPYQVPAVIRKPFDVAAAVGYTKMFPLPMKAELVGLAVDTVVLYMMSAIDRRIDDARARARAGLT